MIKTLHKGMKYFLKLSSYKTLFFLTLTLSIVLGGYLFFHGHNNFSCKTIYSFVNPNCSELIISKKGYLELRVSLEKYFEAEREARNIEFASVYFRDLNNGPVMGINETGLFSSASLLKLPIIMSVLKLAEDKPEVLKIQVVYRGDDLSDVSQFFPPEKRIEKDTMYTVAEAIEYALVYSDNRAIEMLNEFMYAHNDPENNVLLTFKDLGLILPDDLEDRDISTRGYASLFRLLYNSSYLNHEYSEMILKELARSSFVMGLRSGVPSEIVVSHKFGERFFDDAKQLHDCGIVYYPKNPYLLCVMTRGNDFADLLKVIQKTSEFVYEEVNARKL